MFFPRNGSRNDHNRLHGSHQLAAAIHHQADGAGGLPCPPRAGAVKHGNGLLQPMIWWSWPRLGVCPDSRRGTNRWRHTAAQGTRSMVPATRPRKGRRPGSRKRDRVARPGTWLGTPSAAVSTLGLLLEPHGRPEEGHTTAAPGCRIRRPARHAQPGLCPAVNRPLRGGPPLAAPRREPAPLKPASASTPRLASRTAPRQTPSPNPTTRPDAGQLREHERPTRGRSTRDIAVLR